MLILMMVHVMVSEWLFGGLMADCKLKPGDTMHMEWSFQKSGRASKFATGTALPISVFGGAVFCWDTRRVCFWKQLKLRVTTKKKILYLLRSLMARELYEMQRMLYGHNNR